MPEQQYSHRNGENLYPYQQGHYWRLGRRSQKLHVVWISWADVRWMQQRIDEGQKGFADFDSYYGPIVKPAGVDYEEGS